MISVKHEDTKICGCSGKIKKICIIFIEVKQAVHRVGLGQDFSDPTRLSEQDF